jgi:hypothetical protein
MKIAILGCGPAGLLAVEGAHQTGHEVHIYAEKKPSIIGGAQYLHSSIPGLTNGPEAYVNFIKLGSRDFYAHKVYGNMAMEVSWDTFDPGKKPMWSLRKAYDALWQRYEKYVIDAKVDPSEVAFLMGEYDLVVNTIPLKALCYMNNEHTFTSQVVWLRMSAPDSEAPENTIIYSGEQSIPWYRWSSLDGVSTYEYSFDPGQIASMKVTKPLFNDCDCHPGMLRVGRYGRWQKGELSHHAYERTQEAIREALAR